ncbi:uncharacterized protein N0V89_012322 [Didymosphaeria variabile]|uniref:Uncharacterized protein n=1 Tax=Didymosphaeria variabile TaxID=1932322 RepID=A0A9W9C4C3_9PLEO|nr:uncharacterized protein N0V89_012322 [Didymosphaeria variabile]KAJ4344578.1 hypothetical protein N0V89_012322 [Didymosphaeria variabile]
MALCERKHRLIDLDDQVVEPARKKRCEQEVAFARMKQEDGQEELDLCRFFRCPREIRDMVYHSLWKQTPFMLVAWDAEDNDKVFGRIGAKICALYDSWPDIPEGPKQPLPQWLLASKQMLAEGIKQFQDHAVWCVFTPHSLSGVYRLQPLLHPANAKDVIVYLDSLCTVYHLEAYPADIKQKWITGKKSSLETLYSLLLPNEDDEPRLRVLEFRAPVRYLKLDYHPHLYSFFKALEDSSEDEDEEHGVEDQDKNEEDDETGKSSDAVHDDDDPDESADGDIFDLSCLEPPAWISDSLSEFHMRLRYKDIFKDNAELPSAAESMMYDGILKLGSAMIGQNYAFGVFVGLEKKHGADEPCLGQRLEFKR